MTNLISKAFEGHNIRIVTDEQGEPWFVASDIAAVLGYAQTNSMNKLIDEEDKDKRVIQIGGNYVNQSLISESGLYQAIFGSTKPEAKLFKRWVTFDVLPSVRKNGGYITGQEQDSPELIMAKALMVAQSVIESKTIELKRAQEQIAVQAPKADFADRVAGADKGVLLGNFAKTVGIGPKKIFAILREMRILMTAAHNRCVDELLQTGRCPHCQGTGKRPRLGDECPKCHGTGRVVPDAELVSRRFGVQMQQAVERAVDEVIHQASDLARAMDRQVREMRVV